MFPKRGGVNFDCPPPPAYFVRENRVSSAVRKGEKKGVTAVTFLPPGDWTSVVLQGIFVTFLYFLHFFRGGAGWEREFWRHTDAAQGEKNVLTTPPKLSFSQIKNMGIDHATDSPEMEKKVRPARRRIIISKYGKNWPRPARHDFDFFLSV